MPVPYLLSKDEAWRIAANVAKLPKLLAKEVGPDEREANLALQQQQTRKAEESKEGEEESEEKRESVKYQGR